ncbi:hypothetical protein D3C79_629260 [compost metagenome]
MVPVHQPVAAIGGDDDGDLLLLHQLVELLCTLVGQLGLGAVDLYLAHTTLGRVQLIQTDLAPAAHLAGALAGRQRPGTLAQ